MKRIGALFDRIVHRETLAAAFRRAGAGKRWRASVREMADLFDEVCGEIAVAIHNGSFRFGNYSTFDIRDPKSRVIHAPPFRDRVVHHAILAVAGPEFERGAIEHSYACRKGRGQHLALEQIKSWIQPGRWFYKADVRKFYDSVDHAQLRTMLRRRFREQRFLNLLDQLIDSYQTSPGKGLPIGALTSQYLGNFYLDPVDHFVLETLKVGKYVRYMDDILIFGDKSSLLRTSKALAFMLEGLGLEIKNHGILNRCELGVPYLGFVLYPGRVRLNSPGRARLRRRSRELESAFLRGSIDDLELQSRGAALFAHAQKAENLPWRRTILHFSKYREAQEPEPRHAGRLVEQFPGQVPLGLSQQELEVR